MITDATTSVLNIKEITEILPHRYPFLLVDKVLELDLEKAMVIGQKNVSMNEFFFQGHFPNHPIMPGVLILEALAQTGAILIHKIKEKEDKIALLLKIDKAKFRRPVHPGDILYMHGKGIHFNNTAGKIEAKAYVNEKLVTEAEISFVLADKNKI